MGGFLSYSIVSGLLLLSMFLAYKLLLAGEKQHSYNRGILLIIYVMAFASLPLMSAVQKMMAPAPVQTGIPYGIGIAEAVTTPISRPIWGTVLIWIFMAGMGFVAVRTLITWIRLMAMIHSGEKIRHNGYTLVLTDTERFAPFSWMRYIVMSRSDYRDNCRVITAHEMKHIASRHWLDLLMAQVVCIVNWFNPAAWLMRDELMLVHEYQADMAVIDGGHNPQQYQMLLIKKAVGARFPSLANSLNHSKLKKRITMMYKEKCGAGHRLKALALVPVLALTLGVAGVPAVRAAVSTISNSEVFIGKDSENLPKDEAATQNFKVCGLSYNGNETTVVVEGENFGNNLTISGGSFTTMGKTYPAMSLKCNMTNGKATITATFPATNEYKNTSMTLKINGKEVVINLDDSINNHQVEVVELSATPSQSSIIINGNSSSLSESMQIYLDGKEISEAEMNALAPDKIASMTVDKKSDTIRITTHKRAPQTADVMPQYPGGEAAMMQSIMNKLTFPDPGRQWESDASGQTVVGFSVAADGTMTDFKIIHSCGYSDLDNLAIKAVKDALTEKWIPGTTNGKPVAVSYAIPIRYKQK